MLRFGTMLEWGLTELGHTVKLLQPKALLGRNRAGRNGPGKWLGYCDKFLLFPLTLKSLKTDFDVVHICDHSNAMYTRYLTDVPHLVTCHDMLAVRSALGEVLENPVRRTGRQLQRMIAHGLRRAQRVVCDSENTRLELLRLIQRPPETVSRIYLGLNYPYSPMEPMKAKALLSQFKVDSAVPFFIHVGANQWYKNRLGVLRIFDQLRRQIPLQSIHLLMVGPPPCESMRRFIAERGLDSIVRPITGASNEELRAAYSVAQGLIFPSLQEGFGWPILEAQACGCPVYTTARAPMTELGSDSAIYIDPSAEAEAAEIIANSMADRDDIRRRGLENVKRFQSATMMREYVNTYELVVEERWTKRTTAFT